jgi:hypothetical protein
MLRFTAMCLTLALGGCASIMSGSTDQLTLNSTPNGANFLIKDENGKSVHHGSTPATVSLERGDGFFDGQTYDVDFSADGYLPTTQKVDTTVNGWYVGNLAFGGILGFLIIDPATGAMFELPENVNTTLTPIRK